MKKFLICALILTLSLVSFGALAEDAHGIWEIYEAGTSYTADFDNDEIEETMTFTCELDEWDDGSFTLSVGESSITVDYCVCLEPTVYAMKAGYTWYYYGTLFMINEYGPSDDPITYCLLYTDGNLIDVGRIPALVSSFDLNKGGLISTSVRADMVGTWYRDADFMLATGSFYDDEGEWFGKYQICEVPRPIYALGMVVTLKTDIALSESAYTISPDIAIKAGTSVVLTASDDVSRLYVSEVGGSAKGWLEMKKQYEDEYYYLDMINVNGRFLPIDDVFDDILYAD